MNRQQSLNDEDATTSEEVPPDIDWSVGTCTVCGTRRMLMYLSQQWHIETRLFKWCDKRRCPSHQLVSLLELGFKLLLVTDGLRRGCKLPDELFELSCSS
jgi:hypothetical protein